MNNLKLVCLMLIGLTCTSCNTNPVKSSTESTPENIRGVWNLPCTSNSRSNKQRAYMTSSDSIASDSLVSLTNYFVDSECTKPGSPVTRLLQVSITFPGGKTQTALGQAGHMNATIESVKYDGVAVTGNSGESIYESIGREFFDLFLITNNTLYFGRRTENRSGESADERYNELSRAYPFVRQ